MCFVLHEPHRTTDGRCVSASDYDALERAYVKLRHDLLEIMDNPETTDQLKSEHVEHMIAYQGLRASVDRSVEDRLMPWVAPDKVKPAA